MANVYGRFVQYLAKRIGEEFPGKSLNLLAYYNTKHAPTDPRWKLPDNMAIWLCDGNLPHKDLWHYWYSAYAQYRTEWNPEFPVDAAIDEAFDIMFGVEAGAHMKEFHRVLKDAYLKYALGTDDLAPVYPTNVVATMDRELKAAGEAVKGDELREVRWRLVSDMWWPAFEMQRKQAAYEPPVYDVPHLASGESVDVDGRGDEAVWSRARPMPLVDPKGLGEVAFPVDVRFVWGDDGMYGRAEGGYAALAEEGNDLWGNDSIELIFAPGLKREEYYQIAFDYLGRQYSGYQKVAPIIQPVDLNWKAEGFRHAETLGKDRWTCEFFVPFSVFKCAAPKACDKWNFNFVRNKMSKPRDYSGSSLTMRKNTNLAMFGMLRFGGNDD